MFYENGQIVRDKGGGMARTEFLVVYHCEFIFLKDFKKADIR